MRYDELQAKWVTSKLSETKAEVLKPLLPPESILLNVVLQRGRWNEYGIVMTIDATCKGTAGYHSASFFKDFIVMTDAGMDIDRTYGTGKIRGIIPYTTIESYEIVANEISEDYDEYFMLFHMKNQKEDFAFRLFEKRKFDTNHYYPWEYTAKFNGRVPEAYAKIMDKLMANATDYESRARLLLQSMSISEDGFSKEVFQKQMGNSEDEFWIYVMKFLRNKRDQGDEEFGKIYKEYITKRDDSEAFIIKSNKEIKQKYLQQKQLQDEINHLQEEILNLGRFTKNLKIEKQKKVSENLQLIPQLTNEISDMKKALEESDKELVLLKRTLLDRVYEILVQDDTEEGHLECIKNLLKATGSIDLDNIIFIIDMLDWQHYSPTEAEARGELASLIAEGSAVYEDGVCYYKECLTADVLAEIEHRRDETAQSLFEDSSEAIYKAVSEKIIKNRVMRRTLFMDLLNREMMAGIGCLSEKYNQEIIEHLIDNGVMKDVNKIFVALK